MSVLQAEPDRERRIRAIAVDGYPRERYGRETEDEAGTWPPGIEMSRDSDSGCARLARHLTAGGSFFRLH